MRESLHHHTEVVHAIRDGDGHGAARLSRQSLYDYYAGYIPEADREQLRALIDTPGERPPGRSGEATADTPSGPG
ncbi:MAG: hypothetical protein ACRDP3_07945 [Streptomyces sp.]|uniref:hypothetical protein n=1 Tax=Streptomyces sp. TaxID=1931 RepID=UPI003D6BE64E